MTFWETVERGEYVMIALAVLFILSVCVWWVRGAKLNRQKKIYPIIIYRMKDHITEGDIENAQKFCQSLSSPGARVISVGLTRIGKPMPEITTDLQTVSNIEKEEMAKGSRWLWAIAVISPLLGLGGTLVGIIDRLRDLGEMGASVDLSMICGAISPTIVTTVAGLGVGIFSLIAYTFLEAAIDSSRRDLDKVAVDFIDILNTPS